MEKFRIIYFFSCIVVIGIVSFSNLFGKKKKDSKKGPVPTETADRKKEDLQLTLESVNSWLNNCDQKAGILLTFVGVAITVILTSDFMKYLRGYIFTPFMQFCSGESDLLFSWSRFTVFVLLVIAMVMLITCCFYLFRAIRADTDYEKECQKNPNLVETSFIFYGTISKMPYDDFRKGGVKFDEDLKSQIYVNSIIATEKFNNYNEGLFWFKRLLLVAIMLFIAIMLVQ